MHSEIKSTTIIQNIINLHQNIQSNKNADNSVYILSMR